MANCVSRVRKFRVRLDLRQGQLLALLAKDIHLVRKIKLASRVNLAFNCQKNLAEGGEPIRLSLAG